MKTESRDFYAEARNIGMRLGDEGFAELATRLEEAVSAGFTATEVLMSLRWEAKQALNSGLPFSQGMQAELEHFIGGLEKALDV